MPWPLLVWLGVRMMLASGLAGLVEPSGVATARRQASWNANARSVDRSGILRSGVTSESFLYR